MEKPILFAVLGDSAASGVGDSDDFGNYFGWGHHLSEAFNEAIEYRNFSRPGARSEEVLKSQLPNIVGLEPDLVAVIVGGNDMLRNSFSSAVLENNLDQILLEVTSLGAIPLLIELHDPTEIVPMPYLLKRVCNRRVNDVNRVTRTLAKKYSAVLLETRSLPEIYDLEKWHVDRMHPSRKGHQFIADSFAHLLRERGFDVGIVSVNKPNNRNIRDSIIWMVKNGTPWFFKRSFDLLPSLLISMAVELVQVIFTTDTPGAEVLSPTFRNHPQDFHIQEDFQRVS